MTVITKNSKVFVYLLSYVSIKVEYLSYDAQKTKNSDEKIFPSQIKKKQTKNVYRVIKRAKSRP